MVLHKAIYWLLVFFIQDLRTDDDCMVWDILGDNLMFSCTITDFSNPVTLFDNQNKTSAKCSFEKDKNQTIRCAQQIHNVVLGVNVKKKEVMFTIPNIKSKYVDGAWSCLQGLRTSTCNVSKLKGIIRDTDIFLQGELRKINKASQIALLCSSCRESRENYIEFLINGRSEISITYNPVTGKCTHQTGECSPDKCYCESAKNEFIAVFSFNADTETVFSCEMQFIDGETSMLFSKTANIRFNGTDFQVMNTNTNILLHPKAPNKDTDVQSENVTILSTIQDDTDEIDKGVVTRLVLISTLSTIIVAVLITVICACLWQQLKKGDVSKNYRKQIKIDETTLLVVNSESVLRNCIPETVELNKPLLTDNKEPKEHKQSVGKLVLLIAKIAKKVIKRIVTCTLLTDDQTFTSYLNNENNKHTLFHAWHYKKKCCQCKPDDNGQRESLLTKQQFQIMYNNSGSVPQNHVHDINSKIHCLFNIAVNENVSLDVLDVSVANCLIVCGCTPEIKQELSDTKSILDSMKIIKDKRNEIFDTADVNNLSDKEFMNKWQKIRSSVVDLASVVDTDFCNEIKGEIDDLQHENLKDAAACSEKLADLAMQSNQDKSLKINQLYEEKFRSKLTEASKITGSHRYKETNIFTKMDQLLISIVKYPDVKMEDYPDRTTLDVLLQVQAPSDWNEDEIIEIIRQKIDQINSGGNIKIKETTLENFMLIVEIKIATLTKEEVLKDEIEDIFRIICLQCDIDITQPNTLEVSIHTHNEKPSDFELAFIRSFVVQKGKDAFFTSCAVWSDDHYILIDRNNTLLITYNHRTGDVQSVNLRNEPFSMAIIDNNNVAISFPERQEIDIYAVSTCNTFKFREVMKVDGQCYTLTKKDDKTLFVYIEGKGIHSFNMSNKEFKSLDIKIPSFVPHSDEICAQNNRLYHTSRSTSSVFCYDMNGSMLWNFKEDLKTPTALTCDTFGNVYVTDYTSHHLYFISADGLSHKTLLSRQDKLWHPTFVYYCMKRKCLLIVNRDNGYAACYSVKYKQ